MIRGYLMYKVATWLDDLAYELVSMALDLLTYIRNQVMVTIDG